MSIEEMVAKWQMRALLAEKKLDIIAAIDKIRDEIEEPKAMRQAIAELLKARFNAQMCIIGLTNNTQGGIMMVDTVIGENKEYAFDFMVGAKYFAEKYSPDAATNTSLACPESENMVLLIRLKGETLGIVVLVRGERFSEDECAEMDTAGIMIDSAIIQNRKFCELERVYLDLVQAHHDLAAEKAELKKKNAELAQKVRVIEAFKEFDRIGDLPDIPFEEKLRLMAEKIPGFLYCDHSAILLLDRDKEIRVSATTNVNLFNCDVPEGKIIMDAAINALEKTGVVITWGENINFLMSLMSLPLIMKDENGERKIGVIVAINSNNPHGFGDNDQEVLEAIGAMADTGIFEDQKIQDAREGFSKLVGGPKMQSIIENIRKINLGFHPEEDVTVVFTDLRGSSKKAETISSELSCGFTNANLGVVSDCILGQGGMINKFTGDGLLGLFGLPVKEGNYPLCAIKAAIEAQKAHKALREVWEPEGIYLLMGIGIYTGKVNVGFFGGANRFEYTATGTTVNRADRVCTKAARPPKESEDILVCERTYQLTCEHVIFGEPRQIEGKTDEELITVYPVIGLRPN